MDVNNINPVFSAFLNVLPQLGFQTVEKKELTIGGPIMQNKGLMVSISVIGELKGSIIIGMDFDSAKKVASKMMGMEVTELDDMSESAIAEIGNMVCANACSNFSKSGIVDLNISPPTLLIGKESHIKLSSPNILLIKILADGIELDLGVGLDKS